MFTTCSSHLIYQYKHFLFINLFFKILINLSATTDFFSLSVEYISMLLFCKNDFTDLLYNSLSLSTYILFGLQLDSWILRIFLKRLILIDWFFITIGNCNPFLSLKGITPTYLLKASKTRNEKWIRSLHLLIIFKPLRSAT